MTDLLDIPDFLRAHVRERLSVGELERQATAERDQARRAYWARVREERLTREASQAERVKRSQELARQKIERRDRREAKIASRQRVLRAVANGADTFGKLRKRLSERDAELRSALRFLCKTGAVVKASARRYAIK